MIRMFLILMSALLVSTSPALAEGEIAYVDLQRLAETNEGKAAKAELKKKKASDRSSWTNVKRTQGAPAKSRVSARS